MKSTTDSTLTRRKALAGAGVVGAVAAVAAVVPKGAPATAPVAATQPTPEADAAQGYRLTEHIKRYYATARA